MTGVDASRNELVESVVPLVHYLAKTIHRGNTLIDIDDLVSEGYVGAIQAAENFDPTRGLKFSTFAGWRIKGAIQDYLRTVDHLSRSQRRDLEQDDVRRLAPTSLDAPLTHGGTLGDFLPAESEFEESICDSDAARWALEQLDGDRYHVIVEHYWRGRTLLEIGAAIGVTESRVCQIERDAMHQLRMAFVECGFDQVSTIEAVRDAVRRRGRASVREGATMLLELDSLWGDR